MRLSICFALLSISFLPVISSCADKSPQPIVSDLVGSWILEKKTITTGAITTTVDVPSTSPQKMVFLSSGQFYSTVENDSVLASSKYYRISSLAIAGQYFELRKTITDLNNSHIYLFTTAPDEGKLYVRTTADQGPSGISYIFGR